MGRNGTRYGFTFLADYGSWKLPDGHRVLRYIFLENLLTKHDQDFHLDPDAADEFFPGDEIRFSHLYVRNRYFSKDDTLRIESATASFRKTSDQSKDSPFESGASDIALQESQVFLKDDPPWGSGGLNGSENPCYFFGCIGYRGHNDGGEDETWPSDPPFPWVFKENDTGAPIEYDFSFELKLRHTPAGSKSSTLSTFKFDPKWKLKNGST